MRTKTTHKKLLALLLTLVMVLGMLPMAAFAAEGDGTASPSIKVEVASAPTSVLNTATEIVVSYKVTNTGNVPVSCDSYYVQERNDTTHIAPGDATYSVVMPYDDWSWVDPGAFFVDTVTYKVQEADVAAGNLKRAFTCIAHGIEIAGGGGECSDTAIIELPLVDTEPEPEMIETVEVTGVTAPVAGEAASLNFTVPAGADYSKQDRGDGFGFWAEFDHNPTAAEISTAVPKDLPFSFVGGNYYVFTAYVEAKEGFYFGEENIPATMNGDSAAYEQIHSKFADVIGTFYCTSSEAEGGSLEDASITITPKDPTVERGGSLTLAAEVTGLEDKSVTWALGHTYAEGTAIDQNGVLTVAEDETATRIAVSAKANGALPTEDISSYFWVHVIDPTTPETDTVLIPLWKHVAGTYAPAEEFSFRVVDGNNQPFTAPNGEGPTITGNTIKTEGVGEYSGLITIWGTAEEIAAVKQLGINIKENSKSGWNCDATEYIMRWSYDNNRWYMFDTTGLTVIRTFEDYGEPLDQLEFTNTYTGSESEEPLFSVSVDIVKEVVKGGSATPPAQDFEFELFDFGASDMNMDLVIIKGNTVSTNGAGSYRTTLTIETNDEDMAGNLSEGFYLREKQGAAANWTYSDTVYNVHPNWDSDNGKWMIFTTTEETSPNGSWYVDGDAVDMAEFINTYTKTSSGGGYDDDDDTYYNIKATAGTGGSISPSGNVSVIEGGSKSFTMTPASGYVIDNVLVDGEDKGAITSYTFSNVRANHTISVTFKAKVNPPTGGDEPGTDNPETGAPGQTDRPVDPNVPQTGDNSNTALWIALACMSLLGMAATLFGKKRSYSRHSR